MARGWESKSVEAQQDAAPSRQPRGRLVDPADVARRTRHDTLILARTRAEADLRAATATAHREMLALAIADLDREIEATKVTKI